MHLPGKITYKEIDEMIATVDKNEDWKISYSEFRVISCYLKLLTTHAFVLYDPHLGSLGPPPSFYILFLYPPPPSFLFLPANPPSSQTSP